MPQEDMHGTLYRLVLEHGDFGFHNMSITVDDEARPHVTSLFDWETGSIVPAMLSDPLVAVCPVDMEVDEDGDPKVTRLPDNASGADIDTYQQWANFYIQELYKEAPEYEVAIKARDARHLWVSIKGWRGGDSENFFGKLGEWAEERIQHYCAAAPEHAREDMSSSSDLYSWLAVKDTWESAVAWDMGASSQDIVAMCVRLPD